MSSDPDPLLSVSAAAKKIKVHPSTLSAQVRTGQVRSHNGKVRLSEVLADRAANIDLNRSGRRDGKPDDFGEPSALAAAASRPSAGPGEAEASAEDGDRVVMVDGQPMPLAEAKALKESYHAWRAKIAWEVDRGRCRLSVRHRGA